MTYFRTPEHRALQAQRIRQWEPWLKSTGPRTAEGRAKVSQNGYKGGWRLKLRELSKAMTEQRRMVAEL